MVWSFMGSLEMMQMKFWMSKLAEHQNYNRATFSSLQVLDANAPRELLAVSLNFGYFLDRNRAGR
jgi:hypothetical protein